MHRFTLLGADLHLHQVEAKTVKAFLPIVTMGLVQAAVLVRGGMKLLQILPGCSDPKAPFWYLRITGSQLFSDHLLNSAQLDAREQGTIKPL